MSSARPSFSVPRSESAPPQKPAVDPSSASQTQPDSVATHADASQGPSPASAHDSAPPQAPEDPAADTRAEALGLAAAGEPTLATESAIDDVPVVDNAQLTSKARRVVPASSRTSQPQRVAPDVSAAPVPAPRSARRQPQVSGGTAPSRALAAPRLSSMSTQRPALTAVPAPPANEAKARISKPAAAQQPPSAAVAGNAATVRPRAPPPEAPPGFKYVSPEEIPQLRTLERRRRLAFEKDLVAEMRSLYAEKERTRLLEAVDETAPLSEQEAALKSQMIADAATYQQLKQAVGAEAKAIREKKMKDHDEGEVKHLINVEEFTMGSLCKDIPVGDRNETYDDYELARVNRRRETVRVFRAKMWSRNKYEPREGERAALQEAYRKYQDERKERSGKIKTEQQQKFTEIDDAVATVGSQPHAAIEIQANGDISLVGTQYDRHQNNRAQRETMSGPRVEVDPTEQIINSYSFSTKERPDRWTSEETDKFYEALSAWGTDFNLISHLFPMRSRNQIKTKFKYEERRNPVKVQLFLVHRRKANVKSYAKVSEMAIENVDSIEQELEMVRKEHEEQMRREEASRALAKAEDTQKSVPVKHAVDVGPPPSKRRRGGGN